MVWNCGQDRSKRIFVHMEMNHRVHKRQGISWQSSWYKILKFVETVKAELLVSREFSSLTVEPV